VEFWCGKPVLPLEFHDLGPECPAQLADKLMTTTQAKKIARFLFTKKPEAIIVNCEAGISRSAGVAAALAKFFYDDDKEIFKKAIPNMYVYRLTLREMHGR
jgi:protein-tyrosine phosphatase